MNFIIKNEGVNYLEDSFSDNFIKNLYFKNNLKRLLSLFLAAFFLFSGVLTTFSGLTAYAEEEPNPNQEIEKKLDEAAEEFGIERDEDGFLDGLDKANEEDKNSDTFANIFRRMLSVGYINEVGKAYTPDGYTKPSNGLVCDPNDETAGTVVYHNCDVPTIFTEFLQDVLSLFLETGPQNAEITNANVVNKWFGLPSTIPGDGNVPVKPEERLIKYTGLELFGYNLKYTSYYGEWDHIKVFTAARAMSNFGLMDNIKLGVTTIVNGITSGMNTAVDNLSSELSKGNIFGAIGGFFGGLFEGAASGGINTILDTSDLNVINTNAWYRINFGKTLYGARELTELELSAIMQKQFIDMISQTQPNDAIIPEDLQAVESGPPPPLENISKCTIKDSKGGQTVVGNTKIAPGISEADCEAAALAAQAERNEGVSDKAEYTWKVDGTQKQESISDWKKNNSKFFNAAEKYDISCSISDDNSNRKDNYAKFIACWPGEWGMAVDSTLKEIQSTENRSWWKQLLQAYQMNQWMQENPRRNFNASFNRYICVNKDGSDMMSDGEFTFLYNMDGTLNNKCDDIRPPIQNGLFGNGYLNSQEVGKDTRYEVVGDSMFNLLTPIDSIANSISNVNLTISVFLTRISNTIINLSFSPILETLGLNDVVISFIEGFRDSVFLPLVIIAVSIAAVMILINTLRQQNFMKQITDIGMICLTYILGIALLSNPATLIKWVDEIPSMIETSIIGGIFEIGAPEDKLCTSSNTISSPTDLGIDGKALNFNPNASVRTLMCENWKIFAFDSWVYGQWGTNFENLYSYESNAANTMKNTNGELVGDASVNMGNNQVIKNWAAYQLQVTSSGTSTSNDYNRPSGPVDPNFYKIVDMQAGPNNGAESDGRYLNEWSGNNLLNRLTTSGLGSVVSGFGMVTVALYSFAKIEVTFVTTFMLIFLPIIFLIGMIPGAGRNKFKDYFGTLWGLILQRIFLTLLLAVMFKILLGFGMAVTGYFLVAILSMVICVIFLLYRKELLSLVNQGANRFGGNLVNNPRGALSSGMPKSLQNYYATAKATFVGGTAGAMAGAIATGSVNPAQNIKGAIAGAKQSIQIEKHRAYSKERRAGFGLVRSLDNSIDAAKKQISDDLKTSSSFKQTLSDADVSSQAIDDKDNIKDLNRMISIREKVKELEQKKYKEPELENDKGIDLKNKDPRLDKNIREEYKTDKEEIIKLEEEYKDLGTQIKKRETSNERKTQKKEKMKQNFSNMLERFNSENKNNDSKEDIKEHQSDDIPIDRLNQNNEEEDNR